MSQRVCQFLLVVLPLAVPLPVLAQVQATDSVATPRLLIVHAGEFSVVVPRDSTRLWQPDSLRLKALLARAQLTGVACPMPVAVPAPGATVPMPVAKPDSLATVPMPAVRSGCFNPLYHPR